MRTPRNLALAAAGFIASLASAQWSTNSDANFPLADRPGEQVQPKVRATPDGGCYISWFDNNSGGYDVYLQRLNMRGVEQWAHNGLLLCDRGVSSTVDYDMVVDADANAVITYNDDRLTMGGTQQISVQKVDSGGQKLWGANGVMLTNDTTFKGNPRVVALNDGTYVAAWSSGSPQSWTMVHLDADGAVLGTSTVSEASRYLALCDLQPALNGEFIALWIRGTTSNPITSTKHLYSQKFSASGTPQWNAGSPVIVFDGTSVQNGYFPTCIPDGQGGAVYGWYEIGGSRNAYIQHLNPDGTRRFTSPVANTGATAGRMRISAGLAYDAPSGSYYLASTESNSGAQGDYSVIAQKISNEGVRRWGDTGVTVLPRGTGNQASFVQTVALGDDCMVFGIDSRSPTTGVIFGARVNSDQSLPWSMLVSSTEITKSRLNVAKSPCGDAFMAWGNGATGSSDILAQNVRPGGLLGRPCEVDFDGDGFVSGPDFDGFVAAFEEGDLCADFDADGFLTGVDFDSFVQGFEGGC